MTQDTVQIEVTIAGGFLHDGIRYTKGDISTEPYALGEYFIRAGWARDTSGLLPEYAPSTTEVVLLVEDSNQPVALPGVV